MKLIIYNWSNKKASQNLKLLYIKKKGLYLIFIICIYKNPGFLDFHFVCAYK